MSAVRTPSSDDLRGHIFATRFTGAIPDTIAKVDILAQADDIVGSAAESIVQPEDVVDAGLL